MKQNLAVKWLFRETKPSILGISAIVTLGSFVFTTAIFSLSWLIGIETLQRSWIVVAICIIIGIATVPAAILIFVMMLWYWASFDSSSRAVKAVWLLLFLIAGWYAAAVYYFAVFRPRSFKEASCVQSS